MKYLFSTFSFIVCLFFATAAYAEELILLNPDENGEVKLESELTKEGNEYVLVKAEQDTAIAAQVNNIVTFSTLDYRNGIFDKYRGLQKFTGTCPANIYDNVLSNGSGNLATSTGKTCHINLVTPTKITGFFSQIGSYTSARIDFINAGKVVKTVIGENSGYQTFSEIKVTDIHIYTSPNNYSITVHEIEFFGDIEIDYIAPSDINVKPSYDNAEVSFVNPNSAYFANHDIYLNDEVIVSKTKLTNHTLESLKADTEYTLKIRTYYTDGNYIDTTTEFRTLRDTKPPGTVKNLTATQKDKNVLLEYTLPDDADFSHVRILRNGLLVKSELKADSFEDENVPPGVHQYRVISYDESGNVSAISVNITVITMEVTQLKANAKADQVTLSWVNPNHSELETVKIYRKDKEQGLMRSMLALVSPDDGYTPLFATNGTTFEDLTVSSDTAYTYKIASVIDGEETSGVTIDVKTPKLTVEGGTITPQPDTENPTSYVIAWTSPKTGKLKVVIAGVDYKTVNAADLKVTIPAADMKFDKFGNYDVQLVPVDDQGQVIGVPTNPGSGGLTWGGINLGNLGLDPKSLITVGAALLGLVGLIILLAMSFRLVPRLMELLKNSFR